MLNTNLSLQQRVEIALSGFLTLDLFQLLSREKAREYGLPVDSCGMAVQTIRNLQASSLSAVTVACAKNPSFTPWKHGFGRLSELPVEHHFSYLRQQVSNSQLSCRSYWQCSARVSLRTQQDLSKEQPAGDVHEPPVPAEEPLGVRATPFSHFVEVGWMLDHFLALQCS